MKVLGASRVSCLLTGESAGNSSYWRDWGVPASCWRMCCVSGSAPANGVAAVLHGTVVNPNISASEFLWYSVLLEWPNWFGSLVTRYNQQLCESDAELPLSSTQETRNHNLLLQKAMFCCQLRSTKLPSLPLLRYLKD